MEPQIEKIVINCHLGEPQKVSVCAKHFVKLFKVKCTPVRLKASYPKFSLRKGMISGFKSTIRGKTAKEILKKILNKTNLESFKLAGRTLARGWREHASLELESFNPLAPNYGFDMSIVFKKKKQIQKASCLQVLKKIHQE